MLPSFCKDTVYILTAPREGTREERNWSRATSRKVDGCSVQISTTNGEVTERESASISYELYMPPGTPIEHTDRVEFEGETYLIVGMPRENRSPLGMVSNKQVSLKRWVG